MIVGVDPGKSTGVAVYLPKEGILLRCVTLDWWAAMDYLTGELGTAEVVIVEDPAQNAPVFARGLSGAPLGRLAQNVGSNKTMSTLCIERLKEKGMRVIPVRPSKEKWNAETFSQHFIYHGRTSQHARDAARLVQLYITGSLQ